MSWKQNMYQWILNAFGNLYMIIERRVKYPNDNIILGLQIDKDLQDMTRKDLLYLSKKCWWADTLENLWNSGWVYHFNSIPRNPMNRDANYWIERVYKELYEK